MSDQSPYWTEETVKKFKKFYNSKAGKKKMAEIIDKCNKENKTIADSMQFTWERWAEIKDVPFM